MPIQIDHISHIYMQATPFESVALQNVSLSIKEGEFIGLIGHTGSGKSTLIQHLNGILQPTEGKILVDELDAADKASLKQIRKKVGLVFQYPEYQLFEETCLKDIAFGPKNLGMDEESAEKCAKEAAVKVGLEESLLERSPFELSGGQKRRVAIAGVLAMNPKYLILDEPAAGLDPQGRRAILQMMKKLHREDGITLIMVSHSMNDVAELCDRVLVMNKGELAMDGTPDSVFARSKELLEMGLSVPDSALLAEELRKKGFPIAENIWRFEDLLEILVPICSQKGGLRS